MAKQKSMTREFNRLYGNLNELHRRVYDTEKNYPRSICAEWFVSDLTTIIENEALNIRLNDDQIDNIIEKASDLLRTNFLKVADKKVLSNLIKEINTMKTSNVEDSYGK